MPRSSHPLALSKGLPIAVAHSMPQSRPCSWWLSKRGHLLERQYELWHLSEQGETKWCEFWHFMEQEQAGIGLKNTKMFFSGCRLISYKLALVTLWAGTKKVTSARCWSATFFSLHFNTLTPHKLTYLTLRGCASAVHVIIIILLNKIYYSLLSQLFLSLSLLLSLWSLS